MVPGATRLGGDEALEQRSGAGLLFSGEGKKMALIFHFVKKKIANMASLMLNNRKIHFLTKKDIALSVLVPGR